MVLQQYSNNILLKYPTNVNDSSSGSSSKESTYLTNDDDVVSDYNSCVDDDVTKDDEVTEDMTCSYNIIFHHPVMATAYYINHHC